MHCVGMAFSAGKTEAQVWCYLLHAAAQTRAGSSPDCFKFVGSLDVCLFTH